MKFLLRLGCNNLQSNHVNFSSLPSLHCFGWAQLVAYRRIFFSFIYSKLLVIFLFVLFGTKCISMYCVCLFPLHTSTVISNLLKHAQPTTTTTTKCSLHIHSFAHKLRARQNDAEKLPYYKYVFFSVSPAFRAYSRLCIILHSLVVTIFSGFSWPRNGRCTLKFETESCAVYHIVSTSCCYKCCYCCCCYASAASQSQAFLVENEHTRTYESQLNLMEPKL